MRVVIMAQGGQSRLPMLKVRKQLLPLAACNTTILHRTLAQLSELMVSEIYLVAPEMLATEILRWAHRAIPAANLITVTLPRPGNSVVQGLLGTGAMLAGDDVVVLLGDVVYSWACLEYLLDAARRQRLFAAAVSSDLSVGGGEVYGVAYGRNHAHKVVSLLEGAPKPPPHFTSYQPGQLRTWIREVQRDLGVAQPFEPHGDVCHVVDDYTTDFDTLDDLVWLGSADVGAYQDDQRRRGWSVSS